MGEKLSPVLPRDPGEFWRAGPELALFQVNIAPPAIPRAVLKRLGPPPLGSYAREFQQLLASYYQEISCRAYELDYAGDGQEGPETGS
ncbi:uncharacterized conserved protein [Moorella thermoacetica Y72]|uniref:Uncharacterized conserved protein n=1 Tax=Moorella thermoacetica Y72 TaxID=1325331 RepID=A0A0S6UIE4_NEOTH|nr:hypothetical protein [Moorella thermoacetica]GAF27276.1 uncharacterized conserved protein [Moorella thermoacetica Y72]